MNKECDNCKCAKDCLKIQHYVTRRHNGRYTNREKVKAVLKVASTKMVCHSFQMGLIRNVSS